MINLSRKITECSQKTGFLSEKFVVSFCVQKNMYFLCSRNLKYHLGRAFNELLPNPFNYYLSIIPFHILLQFLYT